MSFISQIKEAVKKNLKAEYDISLDAHDVLINETRKEFDGNYTVVLFPFLKQAKVSPQALGESLGDKLVDELEFLSGYNILKGFLNLEFESSFWTEELLDVLTSENYGDLSKKNSKVLVEFSSPNTNKPLHLGHIRNILLGWSVHKILTAAGYDTIRTQIINDRGIAVCKSMLAWQLYGNGETPESTGTKSDHFVGKYYVLFDQMQKKEFQEWQNTTKAGEVYNAEKKDNENKEDFYKRYKNAYFNNYSELGSKAKSMLLKWESDDPDIRALWTQMNSWCYDGFNATYDKLGVEFDDLYYESDTYLLGKKSVESGLENDLFYQKEDGSVWVDLEDAGMDQKILLRSDGTSVYMTQDLGTAQKRADDHHCDKMIYVVGDEQEYHFKVLFEILKKLEEPYADGLYHLSYGMVDLPTGKMKSREGTVVDADDLLRDVISEARGSAEERGDISSLSEEGKVDLFRKIGLGALKYFILKVDPKKRMVFDPKESVDMQGQTGPYIQNAFVRIKSVLRKLEDLEVENGYRDYTLEKIETDIVQKLINYPNEVAQAAENYDPSRIANYGYELAKMYHKFYHDLRILTAETDQAKSFRVALSKGVAKVLEHSMDLLGIEMPERM